MKKLPLILGFLALLLFGPAPVQAQVLTGISLAQCGGTNPQNICYWWPGGSQWITLFTNASVLQAKCDGTDETAAIQAWATGLATAKNGVAPTGTCSFSSAIIFPQSNGISITGAGSGSTLFLYTGANATNNIWTFGNNSGQFGLWNVRGLTLRSNTVMSAGWCLYAAQFVRSNFDDVVIDGQDGSGNCFNGAWFDKVDSFRWSKYNIRASNEGLRLNGTVGAGPKADFTLADGKIANSAIGIHIAGGFGGFFGLAGDIIANGTNILIDTSVAAEGGREYFFGDQFAADSSSVGCGVEINDTLATASAYYGFTGTWIASSHTHNLCIDANVAGIINYVGGTIYNAATGDGVHNASTLPRIYLKNTVIRNNAAWGINAVAVPTALLTPGVSYTGNGSGNTTGFTPTWDNSLAAFTSGLNTGSADIGSASIVSHAIYGRSFVSAGAVPGIAGCSAGTQTGGSTAGTYKSGTAGTCTVTLTFNLTAPTGWFCQANDLTTPADLQVQTSSSPTAAVLAGTTALNDIVNYACTAY